MNKSSRCRRGAIRTKSQVPRGVRLSGSELREVSGVGMLLLGIPCLSSFTFSLTTCVEPSCLDTRDAALVLTPIGCLFLEANQCPCVHLTLDPEEDERRVGAGPHLSFLPLSPLCSTPGPSSSSNLEGFVNLQAQTGGGHEVYKLRSPQSSTGSPSWSLPTPVPAAASVFA